MEQEALLEIWYQNHTRLYHKALSLLRDVGIVEDILQNAIIKAWQHRDTIRSEICCYSWLSRIVYNECMSHLRKAKRYPLLMDDACLAYIPASQAKTDQYLYDELWQAFFTCLPEKCRRIFYLRVEGYRVREIAEMLNIPSGTVKSELHRMRKLVQSSINETMICQEAQ